MTLINKIKDKTAKIAVIGLGYVGLPLVIEFCRAGFDVTGFDVDESKVSMLQQGKSYIKHIDPSHLTPFIGDQRGRDAEARRDRITSPEAKAAITGT